VNNSLGNFLGMIALAAALVIGALFASNAIKESRADSDITVTGSARKAITSDLVQWKGSIAAESSNLQNATAELKKNVERLRQFVATNGNGVKLELAPISSEAQGKPSRVGGCVSACKLKATKSRQSQPWLAKLPKTCLPMAFHLKLN
jgi:hypothetical protein